MCYLVLPWWRAVLNEEVVNIRACCRLVKKKAVVVLITLLHRFLRGGGGECRCRRS